MNRCIAEASLPSCHGISPATRKRDERLHAVLDDGEAERAWDQLVGVRTIRHRAWLEGVRAMTSPPGQPQLVTQMVNENRARAAEIYEKQSKRRGR